MAANQAFPSGMQLDRGSIVGPMGEFYGALGDCNVTFGRELIYRANLAARAVDALRAVAGRMESGMLINHPQACAERADENAAAYAAARAVLVEFDGA